MRKLFFLFVCAAIAAACSSEMEVPSPVNPDNEMVEVSFNLGGDYVSVEETPMTRAFAENAKTLYALQIKEKKVAGYDAPYAWGLFDNMDNARISLKKGKDYIVEALVIIEREDTIFNREGHYSMPFFEGGLSDGVYDELPKITNSFLTNNHYSIYTDGYAIMDSENSVKKLSRVDRYFGKKEFNQDSENSISIDMDRFAFSFTYNVTPPLDGIIRVKLSNFGYDNRVLYEVKAGSNQKAEQILYNAPFGPEIKDRSDDVGILVEWERGSEGLESHTKNLKISVKRKKNYNLNINMNNRDNESDFELNMDNEAFENENYDVN
jgi:hypothetical protein